jgi:uncharacterized protein
MQQDVIAVFPLPNVIFFPQTNLPLHIFEPRYCEMIRDTIENKQLIGMFLLQPGWQDDYYGNPPIYSVGCAGELIHVENLPEGKFNIILRGITRVRALETVQDSPYRKVRVHILPERGSAGLKATKEMKKSLLAKLKIFSKSVTNTDLDFSEDASLVEIAHSIANTLQLDPEEKRRLLEMEDSFERAQVIHEYLSGAVTVLKLTSNFAHLRPTDPNVN